MKGGDVNDDNWQYCSSTLRQQHSLVLEKPKLTWSHPSWLEELQSQEEESDADLFTDLDAMFEEDDEKLTEEYDS